MVNNSKNDYGQTPLYVALRFGATQEMIDMLLEITININYKNTDGSTPLIGLCFGKNADEKISWNRTTGLINILCNKGADITIKNNINESALKILEYKGDKKLINYDIDNFKK